MKEKTDNYNKELRNFDAAICEAMAVSQASASRVEIPTIGFCTRVFTRMCSHAIMAVTAAPKSRWCRKEFEYWDFSAIASHARAILEGYLLFLYLANAPPDEDTQRAYVQTMHMYDCKKRPKVFQNLLPTEEIESGREEEKKIKERLTSTKTFQGLDPKLQRDILAGKKLMIKPPHEIITCAGIKQDEFNFFWNYFSQYTHIFSLTFYRIEENGRNTGLKNDFDLDALTSGLMFSTAVLTSATDQMVELFPDVANVRKGLNSKFSPGPPQNRRKSRGKQRR